jgi:hypothetical protein
MVKMDMENFASKLFICRFKAFGVKLFIPRWIKCMREVIFIVKKTKSGRISSPIDLTL